MARKSDKLLVGVFGIFIVGTMFMNLFTPDRAYSLRENRLLTQRPELSARAMLQGRFTAQFEEYITDEFFFRDQWVLLKADLEALLLRRENNGIYLGRDGYLLDRQRQPGMAQANTQRILQLAQAFPQLPVNVVLAPNSAAIYPNKLPPFAPIHDQLALLKRISEELTGAVNFIPVHDKLALHRDEYIYFKTDHHWTMRGAFHAYQEMAETLGFQAYSYESFKTETITTDFWGTYFSRANNRRLDSDYIEVFTPKFEVNYQLTLFGSDEVHQSLYFPQHLATRDKYAYFLNSNSPLAVIRSDIDSQQKLIVFKDSYAHNLLPFLANHYKEIHVIDLRFFNTSLTDYIEEHQFHQALLLFNMASFSSDSSILNFR